MAIGIAIIFIWKTLLTVSKFGIYVIMACLLGPVACYTNTKKESKKLITIEILISNRDGNNEILRFITEYNEIDTKNAFLLKFTDKVKTT